VTGRTLNSRLDKAIYLCLTAFAVWIVLIFRSRGDIPLGLLLIPLTPILYTAYLVSKLRKRGDYIRRAREEWRIEQRLEN